MLFVGVIGAADDALLRAADVPTARVASAPLAGSSPAAAVVALGRNLTGCAQAVSTVARFKPDMVIATGGYAAFPIVAATAALNALPSTMGLAKRRRAKIVLLEPNATPGLSNRVLAPFADAVWGAYAQAAVHFGPKFALTGTPVRPAMYALPPADAARRSLGLDPRAFTVLAFGGSQGARSLNVAVSAMVGRRRLPSEWQVLHLCGRRDHGWMVAERQAQSNANRYLLLAYLEDMKLAYAAADVAVTRAGASTIAELGVAGLPSILVPYPHAADDHQTKNAQLFADHGAARVLRDDRLDGDSLYWELNQVTAPAKLAAMRVAASALGQPRALHDMVERILCAG